MENSNNSQQLSMVRTYIGLALIALISLYWSLDQVFQQPGGILVPLTIEGIVMAVTMVLFMAYRLVLYHLVLWVKVPLSLVLIPLWFVDLAIWTAWAQYEPMSLTFWLIRSVTILWPVILLGLVYNSPFRDWIEYREESVPEARTDGVGAMVNECTWINWETSSVLAAVALAAWWLVPRIEASFDYLVLALGIGAVVLMTAQAIVNCLAFFSLSVRDEVPVGLLVQVVWLAGLAVWVFSADMNVLAWPQWLVWLAVMYWPWALALGLVVAFNKNPHLRRVFNKQAFLD